MDKFDRDRLKVRLLIAFICSVLVCLVIVLSLVAYKSYSVATANQSVQWTETQCKIDQTSENEEIIAKIFVPSYRFSNIGVPIHGNEAKVLYSYQQNGQSFQSELITPPNKFFRHSSERWLKRFSPGESHACYVDANNPSFAVLVPYHQFEDLNYWVVGNLAFYALLVMAALYWMFSILKRPGPSRKQQR